MCGWPAHCIKLGYRYSEYLLMQKSTMRKVSVIAGYYMSRMYFKTKPANNVLLFIS